MSNLITPNPRDHYQTLLSLRAAGFPDARIHRAMSALFEEFDEPDGTGEWPVLPALACLMTEVSRQPDRGYRPLPD